MMNILSFSWKLKRISSARLLVGVGLVAILSMVSVLVMETAWATGSEQYRTVNSGKDTQRSNSVIPQAAKDTHKADALQKSVDKTDAEAAKKTNIQAPQGSSPSKFWFVNTLRANPALAIFLTLSLGYSIGSIKFGNFSLGAVTGSLLVGVLIGQLDISISPQVKTMFFTMFLFAGGYSVGPQFVRGVARDGAPQVLFAVFICVFSLAITWLAAKMAGFDVGQTAGLWAGAQTISAAIGLATDAIKNSGIDNTNEMINKIPVAYAICYIWGVIGTGNILSMIGPRLIGVNLEEACKEYETELSKGRPESGMGSAWHQLQMRAFEIAADGWIVGKSVAEAEALHTEARMYLERIRRNGKIVDFDTGTLLKAGDVLVVSGPTEALIALEQFAKEVADKELLDIPVESVDLIITSKDVNGRTLVDLAKEDFARGVYLQKITRGATSVDVPILAQVTVHRGDILKLSGTKTHIARIEKAIGYADRPTKTTDMVWVGLFILIFGLIGAMSFKIGGIPITLSTAGGVLIGGLVLGWLRSVYPVFGRLPESTAWFMKSVGLNVFIAIVGITAGPGFIVGLKTAGIPLFFWGMVVTSVPVLVAPLIGKYIFKFHPAINLVCCAGARHSTPAAGMVCDAAKSNIPMLGYTVPYAISNTLMTLLGMVIVLIY